MYSLAPATQTDDGMLTHSYSPKIPSYVNGDKAVGAGWEQERKMLPFPFLYESGIDISFHMAICDSRDNELNEAFCAITPYLEQLHPGLFLRAWLPVTFHMIPDPGP